MLYRHGATYLVGRLIPGLVAFASLVVYTRILAPDDYGVYALVMAAVAFVHVVLFSWLELAVLRILPAQGEDPAPLLSAALYLFLWLVLLTGVGGAILSAVYATTPVGSLILVGVPILWVHAWFELNLKLHQSKLLPVRYCTLLLARSTSSFCLGVALVLYGFGAHGPLVGFLVGSALGCLLAIGWAWRGIRPRYHPGLSKELFSYGLPLTAAAALVFVVDSVDRFMIARYIDTEAVGAYAASYDLTSQSLHVLMMSVNLAAYPLAIRAYERGGDGAAIEQARRNGSLLLAIAVPATAGLIVLAPEIVGTLLGTEYQATAIEILPYIALAVFVAGLKVFFFDLAFQLKRRSGMMIWSVAAAATVNILLNWWWIPGYGVLGAAWATLVAYVVALAVCIILGRHVLALVLDIGQVVRIVFSAFIMSVFVRSLDLAPNLFGFLGTLAAGIVVYSLTAVASNVLESRHMLFARLRLRG